MTIHDLISETDYAAERGVSVRTAQRERALRIGPPFIKLGRNVFFRTDGLADAIRASRFLAGGECMTRLQIRYLMRRFNVTEAQANALAALIWGAM